MLYLIHFPPGRSPMHLCSEAGLKKGNFNSLQTPEFYSRQWMRVKSVTTWQDLNHTHMLHLRKLKELPSVYARLLFCHLQNVVEIRRGNPWKTMKANTMHMSKTNKKQRSKQANKNKSRDLWIGQSHFGPRTIKEWVICKYFSGHIGEKMLRKSQLGLNKNMISHVWLAWMASVVKWLVWEGDR